MQYSTKAAAARIIQLIEGGVDPYDVATGQGGDPFYELQHIANSLGGRRDIRSIGSMAAVTQYLLMLVIVNIE